MKPKALILTLAILLFSLPVCAEVTVTVGDKSITYSDEFVRVLETDVESFFYWLINDIKEKHSHVLDRIIIKETKYNPQKMSIAEKHMITEGLVLESAKARQERFESELEK